MRYLQPPNSFYGIIRVVGENSFKGDMKLGFNRECITIFNYINRLCKIVDVFGRKSECF
jgi:hypothetical protein